MMMFYTRFISIDDNSFCLSRLNRNYSTRLMIKHVAKIVILVHKMVLSDDNTGN